MMASHTWTLKSPEAVAARLPVGSNWQLHTAPLWPAKVLKKTSKPSKTSNQKIRKRSEMLRIAKRDDQVLSPLKNKSDITHPIQSPVDPSRTMGILSVILLKRQNRLTFVRHVPRITLRMCLDGRKGVYSANNLYYSLSNANSNVVTSHRKVSVFHITHDHTIATLVFQRHFTSYSRNNSTEGNVPWQADTKKLRFSSFTCRYCNSASGRVCPGQTMGIWRPFVLELVLSTMLF